MEQSNAQLMLAGALAVGGFALGKAVVDEVLFARSASRDWDDAAATFEEAHYRAAGFRRSSEVPNIGRDMGALVAALVGMGLLLATVPETIDELKKLGQ
jgi:hypothetical protein